MNVAVAVALPFCAFFPFFDLQRTVRISCHVFLAAIGTTDLILTLRIVRVVLTATEARWVIFVWAVRSDVVVILLAVVAA